MNLNNQLVYSVLSGSVRAWSASLSFSEEKNTLKIRHKNSPVLYAVYHAEVFPLAFLYRHQGLTILVSSSRDGELAVGVLKKMGFCFIRGSSSRDGLRSLIKAARWMKDSRNEMVFTVDGPRGPRHQSKPGIIYLASRTGGYIVPVRVKMRTGIKFNSWDRFILPWLWSGCRVIFGEPYRVPPGITAREMEHRAGELDKKLKALV